MNAKSLVLRTYNRLKNITGHPPDHTSRLVDTPPFKSSYFYILHDNAVITVSCGILACEKSVIRLISQPDRRTGPKVGKRNKPPPLIAEFPTEIVEYVKPANIAANINVEGSPQ